jgi:hypothetical protein
MGNGQRNLLVIGVQDLSIPEPVLESVWLLILFPGDASITLLPIFPDPNGDYSSPNKSLMNSFGLNSQQIPEEVFFDQLHQQFWWDNYILIDKVNLSRALNVIHRLSGVELGTILESIPSSWKNPYKALQKQTELLNTACNQLKSFPNSTQTEILIQQIDDHIHTDLNWNELMRGWSSNQPIGHEVECEFPTLILENP